LPVQITFVARLMMKKAATHLVRENTSVLGETRLKFAKTPAPVTGDASEWYYEIKKSITYTRDQQKQWKKNHPNILLPYNKTTIYLQGDMFSTNIDHHASCDSQYTSHQLMFEEHTQSI